MGRCLYDVRVQGLYIRVLDVGYVGISLQKKYVMNRDGVSIATSPVGEVAH